MSEGRTAPASATTARSVESATTVRTTRAPLGSRFDNAVVSGFLTVVSHALGPYQTAILRIGIAATWLFFLLREIPHRHELYGPDSPWGFSLAERLIDGNKAFTVLLWSDSGLWFESVYFFALAASVGLMLGWRTRTMSVFFMIGVFSLQNRSVFMGDGGDNVIHLMALYLVFTRCAQVWSLDARRTRRREAALRAGGGPESQRDRTGVVLLVVTGLVLTLATGLGNLSVGWGLFFWALWLIQLLWYVLHRVGTGEPRSLATAVANVVHNTALLVIMAEVCVIYATAGWYKVQGSRWQDGTATWYPLNLDYFAPWPALNELLGASGLVILVLTYGTVFVQVAFPFALFNRKVKNVLLAIMIVEHLSIAFVLGLPFFSMAMIAIDAVFLPTVFLLWLGTRTNNLRLRARRRARRLLPGRETPPPASEPDGGGTADASAEPEAQDQAVVPDQAREQGGTKPASGADEAGVRS